MGQKEDIEKVTSKIILIRDTQVIIDRDVAELYGVTTREINQALKNNPRKFPSDFVIELTNSEKQEVIKNFDNLKGLKFSRVAPHAFTEQGLYMLATILKGDLATDTSLAIVRTFTKLRQLPDHMPDLYIQERLRRAACIRHYHYYRYAHYSPQVFQLLHGCKNVLFYSLSRGYNYFHDYSVPHGCNHF